MHACDEWMDGWIWVGIGNSTAGPKLIHLGQETERSWSLKFGNSN